MSLIYRIGFWGPIAAITCAVAGCGGQTGPAIYPVSGVVLRDGAPLADANIEFMPDKGRPSAGTTDGNGKFVLEYIQGQRGALKGPHKVRVVERFQGARADAAGPAAPIAPQEPKSYDLTQPAQVNATANKFVIDVTAGTATPEI